MIGEALGNDTITGKLGSGTTRRRATVLVATLAAVAVVIGASPLARAQPTELAQPAMETEANREAARAKLVEGVAALKRRDHQAALTRFEEAYALVPSPKIHYDFGLAYVGLGRTADALAAFERFLAEAPDAPPETREKAASLIPTLRARLAEAAARNDAPVQGVSPPPARAQGETPGQGVGPVSPPPEARLAGGPAAHDDSLRTRRFTAISVGAAGAGLLAAGLVFGALARREDDSLTRDSQMGTAARPTPFDPGKESRGIAYERLAVIGLVAGAVAVAAGAVLYATSRRRVMAEPVAGPSFAGATLRLTF
jgi:hypothetical protein